MHKQFDRPDWMLSSACRDHNVSVWFPTGSTGADDPVWDSARSICMSCPVRSDCLEWSLLNIPKGDNGMFGATTPDERDLIRRERKALTMPLRPCEGPYCREDARGDRFCSPECRRIGVAAEHRRARLASNQMTLL